MLHQAALQGGLVLFNAGSSGGAVVAARPKNDVTNQLEYRKPNFSDREKIFLISQVRDHQNAQRQDGNRGAGLRKHSWVSICAALNEFSPHVQRTVKEVNKKWRNLSFAARREEASFKSAKQANPNSTNIKKISDVNLMILEILKAEEQENLLENSNYINAGGSDSESVIFEDEIEFEEENSNNETSESAGCELKSVIKQSPTYKCEINLDPIVATGVQTDICEQNTPQASNIPWTIQSVQSLQVESILPTTSARQEHPPAKRIRLQGSESADETLVVSRVLSPERQLSLDFARETLKLERERLEIERERLKLEKAKMALEEQKLKLEKMRLSLSESRDSFSIQSDPQLRMFTYEASSGNAILIKGGKVVNDDDMFLSDVLIEDNIIKEVGVNLSVSGAVRVIDARGKYVMPGGIDTHTHMSFIFMGAQTVDDFFTGTRAALAGGTTMIIDFAQDPSMSLLDIVSKYRKMADGNVCCDYGLHMIVKDWSEQVRQDMALVVKDHGINSFKMFMAYKDVLMMKDEELLECFDTCAKIGALAMVHAENGDVIHKNEKKILGLGITGPEGHLYSRPEDVEAEATHRAVVLADHVNCPVYIVHVMSKSAANIITLKKKEGCVVLGEPIAAGLGTDGTHYFNRCWRHAACHILSPPLRNDPTTPGYLMDKLASGELECTGTDHCCFSSQQKALGANDFTKIPNGINGVQERMAVIWDKGVVSGKLTPCRFVAVTSTNAAKVFNLYPRKGRIQPLADADIVVWDPEKKQTISPKTHLSCSDFNIFDGMELQGAPVYVISRGVVVVDNGKVNAVRGHGKFVPMAPYCSYVYDRVKERTKATKPHKVEREPYKAK